MAKQQSKVDQAMFLLYALGGGASCVMIGTIQAEWTLLIPPLIIAALAAYRPKLATAGLGALLFWSAPALLYWIVIVLADMTGPVWSSYDLALWCFLLIIATLFLTPPTVLYALACAQIAFLIRHVAAGRRPKPGFCATCGYNLRGLTSNRCPECGTVFRSLPPPPEGPSAEQRTRPPQPRPMTLRGRAERDALHQSAARIHDPELGLRSPTSIM